MSKVGTAKHNAVIGDRGHQDSKNQSIAKQVSSGISASKKRLFTINCALLLRNLQPNCAIICTNVSGNSQPVASVRTRAQGLSLFNARGAKALHAKLRAQGRVPGAEARAARSAYAKARREAKELIEEKGRSGTTMPEGTY